MNEHTLDEDGDSIISEWTDRDDRSDSRANPHAESSTGLNRALLGIAPREQTNILERVGARAGTRIEPTNPRNTSLKCNACGYTRKKNRKSQAAFKCGSCGPKDNADANAARNMRDRGKTRIRVRMDASRQAGQDRKPKEPMQVGDNDGQERSLARTGTRPVREDGPTGRPVGCDRGSSTPTTISRTQESWPLPRTQESRPVGQIS